MIIASYVYYNYVINLNTRMCCHNCNRKDVPRSITNILTLQMHKTDSYRSYSDIKL